MTLGGRIVRKRGVYGKASNKFQSEIWFILIVKVKKRDRDSVFAGRCTYAAAVQVEKVAVRNQPEPVQISKKIKEKVLLCRGLERTRSSLVDLSEVRGITS